MSENIVPKSLEARLTYEINLLKQQMEQMKANQRPSDALTYVMSGTATIPAITMTGFASAYENFVTVPHNLGYSPALLAFGEAGTQRADINSNAFNYIFFFNGSTIIQRVTFGYTDQTNLYLWQGVVVDGTFSGITGYNFPALSVRYYLLRESAV